MVTSVISVFAARFNQAVSNRKRTFIVPVCTFSSSILGLFFKSGYVSHYSYIDTRTYLVYLNLRAINFQLQPVPKFAQFPRLSSRNFRRLSTSGISFIVNTFTGMGFVDTALISKLGGSVIFKLILIR